MSDKLRSTPTFSFKHFSSAIAKRTDLNEEKSSFVIGITGPWGSGKTTLMNMVLDDLANENITLTFNAWSHSKQDEIWRAFFVTIVSRLQSELDYKFPEDQDGNREPKGNELKKLLEQSQNALYRAFTKELPGEIEFDAGKLASTGAKLALKFVPWGDVVTNLGGWFGKKDSEIKEGGESDSLNSSDIDEVWSIFKRGVVKQHVAKIESLEQFKISTEEMLSHFISQNKKLVVAIDDIDRCLPEQSLEILEAIKLFFDIPNAIFLVAMDNEVIQHGLDLRYGRANQPKGRISAELYAEKMLDLSFAIPSPNVESFKSFVESELPKAEWIVGSFDMLKAGLPQTPRTWVRFANRVALRSDILEAVLAERKIALPNESAQYVEAFLKLEVLWFKWPRFMRSLGSFEEYLRFERAINLITVPSGGYDKGQDLIELIENGSGEQFSSNRGLESKVVSFDLYEFISSSISVDEFSDWHEVLAILYSLD